MRQADMLCQGGATNLKIKVSVISVRTIHLIPFLWIDEESVKNVVFKKNIPLRLLDRTSSTRSDYERDATFQKSQKSCESILCI